MPRVCLFLSLLSGFLLPLAEWFRILAFASLLVLTFTVAGMCYARVAFAIEDRPDPTDFSLVELVTLTALGAQPQIERATHH